jgi:hypothetical protein
MVKRSPDYTKKITGNFEETSADVAIHGCIEVILYLESIEMALRRSQAVSESLGGRALLQ